MSQYIIDTLGWMLIIGGFSVILGIAIFLVTPLIAIAQFEREHKHGQMLELMDKQIELERVLRMPLAPTGPDGVPPAPDNGSLTNGQPPLQNDVLIIG